MVTMKAFIQLCSVYPLFSQYVSTLFANTESRVDYGIIGKNGLHRKHATMIKRSPKFGRLITWIKITITNFKLNIPCFAWYSNGKLGLFKVV